MSKEQASSPGTPSRRKRGAAAASPRKTPSKAAAEASPAKPTTATPVDPAVTPKRRGRPPKDKENAAPSSTSLSAKRVAESLEAARSTPLKRAKTDVLPSFDEDVFGTPTLSTETFRANEALRKQREARNFTFDGDAQAPRRTRSGKIVTPRKVKEKYGHAVEMEREESVEVNGSRDGTVEVAEETEVTGEAMREPTLARETEDLDEEERRGLDYDIELEDEPLSTIAPLSPAARTHVLKILQTLTGCDEPTFVNEEQNEALQGLVALLNGTVERGEGNSALMLGQRGAGKTRTVERALQLIPSSSKTAPIVVRLSGHAQTDDRRAIREMGRQIALAEGQKFTEEEEEVDDEATGDYAPTTLPAHLLALLTKPSPRAIIVIIDEFDLFTEHARQALLYCLLDVVQSVQTGPVETTPRGLAVIGVTCRVDTILLLEKRVKSRFSHRVWNVPSPLSPGGLGWSALLRRALIPWDSDKGASKETQKWMGNWDFAVDMLLSSPKLIPVLDRLTELTPDVRVLYRPFIAPVTAILSGHQDFLALPVVAASVKSQLELCGWSALPTAAVPGASAKLRGLPHPALGVLVVSKHLAYAGRTEFSLAQVEDEYLSFARQRLVGSGRQRWPLEVVRRAFEYCRRIGLLIPAGPANVGLRFAKVRSALSPHDIVAFFRADGGASLGPEMVGWAKMPGGHV